ncbi:PfkB family carbohydrate kinase [Heyndrickxia coagulans]|uniref:PfkB family carbohydrate kinase n=1 Tax=Heyndrickxia TaxID=2837504 RepID=UPI0021B4466E|nr:PfkB family carbohydrate kinase [Heyndrickxia coagulans]UXC22761.1 PfkB family carbohydrate kinase [Heyndrickxia coagulans]
MRVLGLGDNVVDIYEDRQTMYPGGNALNFAVFASKLGAEAAFLGAFGTDEKAEHVRSSAQAFGVDLSQCRTYEGENGYARVTLNDGDRVFLGSNKGGVLSKFGLKITENDANYLKTFDLIHFNINGFSDEALPLVDKLGPVISYDFSDTFTKKHINEIARYIDIACFSCSHLTEVEIESLSKVVQESGCPVVLCTRGDKGAILFTEGKSYRQPAHFVEAKDTMGAGDAFITCFLVHYVKGLIDNHEKELLIKTSLEKAADFSAKQCLTEGSFGNGKKIN